MKRFGRAAGLLLLMAMNHTAMAQIHLGTMRLFVQDLNAALVNVYDIRTESLLKSLNTGDKITYTEFSTDQTKLYALGVQTLCIIDVNTLDLQVMKLFSEDEAYFYIEGNPNRLQNIVPVGVTENGLAVSLVKKDFIVFDAHQAGKRVTTYKSENGRGCLNRGNLFIAGQDGIVRVIDPLTGAEKDRLSNVFDANALTEARNNSIYDNKHINLNMVPYGNHILSNVYLGSSDGGSLTALYDLNNRTIVYSKRVPQFETLKVLPMVGNTSLNLFQRHELLDPDAKVPDYPTMPVSPDFSKLKVKDMQKASDEYAARSAEYVVKMKEVTAKRQEMSGPKNFRCIIYSDVNCTQEVMRIDGTQYVSMYGDLIWVIKDTFCEIYDIRTKQLLYTIYLV